MKEMLEKFAAYWNEQSGVYIRPSHIDDFINSQSSPTEIGQQGELMKKIEFWTKRYEFSFQFWGEGQNNVYINKDFVEVASFGGYKTIEGVLNKVINWCEKSNPRIKYD